MEIPNLLNCLILTRSTLSVFLHPSLHLSSAIPSPLSFPTNISSFLYLSLTTSLSSFLLSLSSSLVLSSQHLYLPFLSLPPFVSPPSFSTLPFLFCSLCCMYSQSILSSMSLLIPLSSSPSLFFPPTSLPSLSLPLFLSHSPPSLCFLIMHITTYLTVTTTVRCTSRFKRPMLCY